MAKRAPSPAAAVLEDEGSRHRSEWRGLLAAVGDQRARDVARL